MALAGNQDDVALLSQHTRCADGLAAVGNGQHLLHLFLVEPCHHVVDDVLGFLEARIVAGDDDAVALLHGFLSHQRTLALVAVATGTADGDHPSLLAEHLVDGVQHVLQGIWCMGIVDDGRKSLRRADGVETSIDTLQCAHGYEYVFGLLAEHDGSAIDAKQVRDVETPNELHADLATVDLKIHTLEVALDDACTEVCQRPHAVGLHLCPGVLHHILTVLVVSIGNGESLLAKSVEEHLLGVAVVLHRLMIVQVVARKVRKQSAHKPQSADAVLRDGVARALHEGILAACLHHACQQGIQLDGVGRGVRRRDGLVLDVVAHRRQEAALIAQLAEHII